MSDLATLFHFLRRLRQRHEFVLAAVAQDERRLAREQARRSALLLAESFLRRCRADAEHKNRSPQLAVIGPTQAGKSSVVNALLGAPLAGVSPLAGYTVHAHGFAAGLSEAEQTDIAEHFAPFRLLPVAALESERTDAYALTLVPEAENLPGGVIWDTPDFDSIDAGQYRAGVLRAVALADALLLVVSKDKYADQSVWDMLSLITPLGQPLAVCINKVDEASREMVVASLRRKWMDTFAAPPPIVTLPYRPGWGAHPDTDEQPAALLETARALLQSPRSNAAERAAVLLRAHWDDWLEAPRAERHAAEHWRTQIDAMLAETLQRYQRDFLDHPQHYETFQHTLAELLTLLEPPGIGAPLRRARRALTWPVRKLFRLNRPPKPAAEGEQALLTRLLAHGCDTLREAALVLREEADGGRPWWEALNQALPSECARLEAAFRPAVSRYTESFRPEIEQAAGKLLERLREHPATLNTLRATRIGADAAALALAFKTGGIGLHDFLLAPAVLSLTSLLTESALGQYLGRVRAELKQRQREAVTALFETSLRQPLEELAARLDGPGLYRLPEESLREAERALQGGRS
jgi:GTP-binding protein EngB required for normal cell division